MRVPVLGELKLDHQDVGSLLNTEDVFLNRVGQAVLQCKVEGDGNHHCGDSKLHTVGCEEPRSGGQSNAEHESEGWAEE